MTPDQWLYDTWNLLYRSLEQWDIKEYYNAMQWVFAPFQRAHTVCHTHPLLWLDTRASSRLSAGKENKVASRPVIRLLLGFWRRLLNKYAIFSAFHKIIIKCLLVCDFLSIYAQEHRRRGWTDCCELKVQEDQETSTFCTWRTPAVEGPAIQVFVHASVITLAVGRVEARIEAVEEELRLEKQKSAALQQKQMSPSSNAAEICQEGGVVPQCSRCSGKSATAELSDGSGDNSKTSVKKRSSKGGEQVKRIFFADF